MSIIIGSARHDENGKYVNGSAGDQLQTSSTNDTVGEVSMQSMYAHSKGWYIMRPKSVAHANAIAAKMKAACNNANIGYDQNGRLGIITYGISTSTKTECDCSSLVRECVKEATGKDPGNFTTASEVSMLAATGLFEDKISYVAQETTPVYDGDILVTKTKGHTVVAVSGNARSATTGAVSSGGITAVNGTAKAVSAKYKDASIAGTYKVNTLSDPLMLRTDASGSAAIIAKMAKGTSVRCYGYYNKDSSGMKWYYVVAGSYTGYASSKYLKK